MLLTGLLTVSAFLLIAQGATREERSPLLMAIGILLLAGSALGHFTAYTSILSAATALSAEIGVGLFVVAGFLARKKRPARSLFMLGALALGVSVVLMLTGKYVLSAPGFDSDTTTYLVELGPDDSIDELEGILARYGATSEQAFPGMTLGMDEDLAQVFMVHVSRSSAEALEYALISDRENVDHLEVNEAVSLYEPLDVREVDFEAGDIMENDPMASSQWALAAINAHEVHEALVDAQPVRKARVAIVDTGVDAGHEDIKSVFANSPGSIDNHGHGSHCAGIAGAATNNGLGIASLNWEGRFIDVTGYKALNDQGMGTLESISQAVLDAARDGADVISMSLGGKSPQAPKTIADAIRYAINQGSVVIVSAGNSNEDARYHMPSNVKDVIVVSAVDSNLRKASFSNTNTSLARPIAAPGVNILSLKSRGGYVEMSGTSMSTPVVSGIVGIMRALNPDISVENVYEILHETGGNLRDSKSIGRMVDAKAAIEAAVTAG